VQIGRGGRALRPVFFWLVNRTDQPRHLSTDQILYRLETLEPDARSGARQVRHMLGDRDLPAAGAVCLANVSKLTQPGLISSAQGRVRAVLHAYFTLMGMGRQSLISNEIEIEVVP
jgi:hypothetical protein